MYGIVAPEKPMRNEENRKGDEKCRNDYLTDRSFEGEVCTYKHKICHVLVILGDFLLIIMYDIRACKNTMIQLVMIFV